MAMIKKVPAIIKNTCKGCLYNAYYGECSNKNPSECITDGDWIFVWAQPTPMPLDNIQTYVDEKDGRI